VLDAASVPPEGGNGFDCMQARHRDAALEAVAAADAAGIVLTTPLPRPEAMRRSSGEELTDEQHAFACDPLRCVEDSFNLYRQPVRWSQVAGIPVTYVVNGRDRAIPPDLQREMAARLPEPPTIVELDAGHLPMVTRPEDFARIVADALAGAAASPRSRAQDGSGGASKRGQRLSGGSGGVGPGSTATGPPAAIESTNERPIAG
jgi:pimeloyl-ACP methyl ester carboxylesterase